ncbi:MAG: hypothetical protein AAF628_37115 [Planctomycetota bacterium]
MSSKRIATGALSALALVSGVAAQPQTVLTLDGEKAVVKQLGSNVKVSVRGTPGRPAWLLWDVSAGPTIIFGQSVPLGFTPALRVLSLGALPASGTVSLTFPVPASTTAHGVNTHFVALVDENGTIAGFNWSNGATLTPANRPVELVGNRLAGYPFFEIVRAVNRRATVQMAIDPTRYPFITGKTTDVYVTRSKTRSQWDLNPALNDVRGAPQTVTFTGATIQGNTITLSPGFLRGPNEAPGSGDTRLGAAYDVVIDVNRNGRFDGADFIDGYDNRVAGFYVTRDLSRGGTKTATGQGPHPVTEILYGLGAPFSNQDTYYPTNIASLGKLPLVVISHGNGHNYQWYDHLGYHLASYGYIVMSHQNNTIPGSHTAAITTLENTDNLIGNQTTIGGGVLNGHIDEENITWIGHSRGGDGVARAYDRLFTGSYVPNNYKPGYIKLVSSIAPVDFGGTTGNPASDPHDVTYHLWVGQADADVNGCPLFGNQIKWYLLHDRATRVRQSISLYGVGHGDFHDGGGSSVASGPNLIGRTETHKIMRGYALALIDHYIRGDVPARDFLWRQYESFRAVGASFDPNAVANLNLRDDTQSGKFVIDDFQTNPSSTLASSGATVSMTVQNYLEGNLADNNGNFTWQASDPFNGYLNDSTSAAFATNSLGAVFDFDGAADYDISYTLLPGQRDWRKFIYLSFRAAQGTRHPFTTAALSDLTFTVTLQDRSGARSSINIGAYGGGLEDPYQRNSGPSCGTGFGWTSEFETVRIRLEDFLNNGNAVDLAQITRLIFNFGPSWGDKQGRLGLDEIELTAQ